MLPRCALEFPLDRDLVVIFIEGNKTEQRVGDRVVEDEQFSKLLRAQEENHKLYQQLGESSRTHKALTIGLSQCFHYYFVG